MDDLYPTPPDLYRVVRFVDPVSREPMAHVVPASDNFTHLLGGAWKDVGCECEPEVCGDGWVVHRRHTGEAAP